MYFSQERVEEPEFRAYARSGHLPRPLRALYEVSRAGVEVPGLGFGIHPWPPGDVKESGVEEQDDFPLPGQMQVFGGDLGNDVWTFWLQTGGAPDAPPVLVIADRDVYSIRSAGTVAQFLRMQTGLGLLGLPAEPAVDSALDALGVPAHLRDGSLGEQDRLRLMTEWVDPDAARYGYGYYGDREPLGRDELEGLTRDLG